MKTGVELFSELGADPDGETMALISQSAMQASDKLQFFRLAYGSAGSAASGVSVADALGLIKSVCGNQRTTIETDALDDQPPLGGIKLMLNGAMLAGDCLPRGGVVTPDFLASRKRPLGIALYRDETFRSRASSALRIVADGAVRGSRGIA